MSTPTLDQNPRPKVIKGIKFGYKVRGVDIVEWAMAHKAVINGMSEADRRGWVNRDTQFDAAMWGFREKIDAICMECGVFVDVDFLDDQDGSAKHEFECDFIVLTDKWRGSGEGMLLKFEEPVRFSKVSQCLQQMELAFTPYNVYLCEEF
ncbi:hypothetical protein EIP91_011199 [Steccherinum ochraceum]|uniref:Uncharacterized protein n=1 Tax=Steccherinum ochraceum TaxID=92696 RepID=A0A4R0R219_9APHY|nr:hypothetical protein EIP91_011199 [Steccherinum ochraceum]